MKLVGEFTEALNTNFRLPEKNKYIFSGVESDETGKYTVYFDILYNNIPVIIKRPLSDGKNLNHAIEIEFTTGRVISYRQLLKGFNSSGDSAELPPMINALDEFYSSYNTDENPDLIINDICSIYHYDTESNRAEVKSAVSLSNKEVVIVKP